MKNNKNNYRLVARMQGNQLMINADVRDELARIYDRRIAKLEREERDRNRRAHLIALECERKGDFLFQTGLPTAALRAYIDAAMWALNGEYYDWNDTQLPAYALYVRSRELIRKIKQCAATDPRLQEILRMNRSFRQLHNDPEWEEIYG